MLQLAVDEKRSRRKTCQETLDSRSPIKDPLRRHSNPSLCPPPPGISNPHASRRKGLRSRGLKKILSRENENTLVGLLPRTCAIGMNKKDTVKICPPSIPVPVSSTPSNELYCSINVESVLVAASGDIQNVPGLFSAPGEHTNIPPPPSPSSRPTSYASSSTPYPGDSKPNLTVAPLVDFLSESDSDSERSQSSGNDSCSKASTMTRSGSSMSMSVGHIKKVLRHFFEPFFPSSELCRQIIKKNFIFFWVLNSYLVIRFLDYFIFHSIPVCSR